MLSLFLPQGERERSLVIVVLYPNVMLLLLLYPMSQTEISFVAGLFSSMAPILGDMPINCIFLVKQQRYHDVG